MIFIDLTFLVVVIFIVGVGSAAVVSQWVLNHVALVMAVLILKSILCIGTASAQNKSTGYYLSLGGLFVVDVAKNALFLAFVLKLLEALFSGGLLMFLVQSLGVIIGVPLGIIAAEGPMYFAYELLEGMSGTAEENIKDIGICVLLELLSIVGLAILYWYQST
jgi:hypothetical protein